MRLGFTTLWDPAAWRCREVKGWSKPSPLGTADPQEVVKIASVERKAQSLTPALKLSGSWSQVC